MSAAAVLRPLSARSRVRSPGACGRRRTHRPHWHILHTRIRSGQHTAGSAVPVSDTHVCCMPPWHSQARSQAHLCKDVSMLAPCVASLSCIVVAISAASWPAQYCPHYACCSLVLSTLSHSRNKHFACACVCVCVCVCTGALPRPTPTRQAQWPLPPCTPRLASLLLAVTTPCPLWDLRTHTCRPPCHRADVADSRFRLLERVHNANSCTFAATVRAFAHLLA